MSVYPLYPNSDFSEFNTSLSIPGIKLWDLPVGNCIKDLQYPNTKSLLLLPDIEYIKKFSTYDLGIADMVLKAALSKNLSRTKDPNLQLAFDKVFKQSNLPGAGLKSLEKTVISSIFESYKPFFVISQFVIENVIDIEDIIARLAILTSPLLPVKPFKIKSRKPVGNSGDFGTPTAMGYKNGKLIKESVLEFKRISKKGLDIKISNSGKSTVVKKDGPKILIGGDTKFDYVTISSVYSTGVFKNDIKYNYTYIDIPEEQEAEKEQLNIDNKLVDIRPNIIILGVFDSAGNPVDPNNKKLSWVTKSEKWILDKSIDLPNAKCWKIINNVLYHWERFGQIKIQRDIPNGLGWRILKYGDIIDFSIPNNENSKYKKDDPVLTFVENDISDFKNFFDSKIDNALVGKGLDKSQESSVRSQIKKIYNGKSTQQPGKTLLSEHVQNLIQFSKLKHTPYIGYDDKDTRKQGNPTFNKNGLVFKPMRFKISGKDVWIDPETEYDYKIIQVDSYNIFQNRDIYSSLNSSFFRNITNDIFLKFNLVNNSTTTSTLDLNSFKDLSYDSFRNLNYSIFRNVNYIIFQNIQQFNPSISNIQFSKGKYGDGDIDSPQKYGYLERPKIDEFDSEKFYIIEAIKKESNKTDKKNSGVSGGEDGFYKLPDALGVTPVMINLSVKIFTKLVPEITKLISLLNNPAQFVIDIITQKIKDPVSGFSFFTDEATKILSSLPGLSSKVKSGLMDVDDMIDIVKNSHLGNYIHVDQLGDWKFVLNGEGTTDFLGIIFGIKVDFMNSIPLSPIIDSGGFGMFGSIFNTKCGEDDVPNRPTNRSNINTKVLDNSSTESPNSISNNSGGDLYYEETSVKYSTGTKVDGVNYKYIYIDQEMTRLISEADELANLDKKSLDKKPEQLSASLEEAMRKYLMALDKERGKDAVDRNEPLITMLMSKINEIRQKLNILIQPIFKMLFGLVSMPLKLVLKIINCILDFFKSLLDDPLAIPSKIAKFLTFDWIIKLFKPSGLLFLAGIDFSPEKLAMWGAAISGKIDLKDIPMADLKDFLFSAYQMVLPEFTEKQFKDLGDKPFRILVPTLTLFQMIINAVIMLIWSVLGISAVLPPPLMCNKYEINDSDLSDILSGLFKDNKKDDPKSTGDSYTFIYDVKLGDGTTRRLDANVLQNFIDSNKDTNFDFNNFKTIE